MFVEMSLSFEIKFVGFLDTIIEASDLFSGFVFNAFFCEGQVAADRASVHYFEKQVILGHTNSAVFNCPIIVHDMLVFVAEILEGNVALRGGDRHLSWCF